jgi:cytochrome d ubiquinol oxidase subunit I
MSADVLSRLQFAFTIGYHILWPTFTIGTSAFVTCLSFLTWWTNKPVYRDLLRFWMRLFALGFGMGVITGVVLSYEIGTNWAAFSRAVSNVVGPLLMYEAATAFFLESGFIGIMLYGEGRISRGLHVFACAMVTLGALISATWIIAANSWMQTPAGAVADTHGVFHVVNWWHVVFSPSFPYRLLHMVCASFLTCSFVVAGVSAFHLLQRRHKEAARTAFSMALWAALLLGPLQIILGDMHGLNTKEYQPIKLAAMEGLWDTQKAVPATLFAWPDMAREKNLYEVSVPHLASLYLTHTWDGEVQGLKAAPPQDRPYVPIVFFAFRVMVGVALLLLALAITGAVLRFKGRLYDAKWFLYLAALATPLGFIAVLAGWTVTETGRQPFVVYGLLRTADASSPVSAGAVTASLVAFVIVYNLLLLAFLYFGGRLVIKGPTWNQSDGATFRPGLDRAAPTVLGGPPANEPDTAGALVAGE